MKKGMIRKTTNGVIQLISFISFTFLVSLSQFVFAKSEPLSDFSVGPQYDTTHVYVAPQDFDTFVASFIATFGGTTSQQGVFQVTPTPSKTMSQLALTPVGT